MLLTWCNIGRSELCISISTFRCAKTETAPVVRGPAGAEDPQQVQDARQVQPPRGALQRHAHRLLRPADDADHGPGRAGPDPHSQHLGPVCTYRTFTVSNITITRFYIVEPCNLNHLNLLKLLGPVLHARKEYSVYWEI